MLLQSGHSMTKQYQDMKTYLLSKPFPTLHETQGEKGTPISPNVLHYLQSTMWTHQSLHRNSSSSVQSIKSNLQLVVMAARFDPFELSFPIFILML